MPRAFPVIATLLIATSLSGCFGQKKKDVSDYLVRAETFAAQGDSSKARVELENGLRISPADPKLNFALAKNEEASGDLQAAIPHYLRAAAPDANLREAQIRTIELLLDAGRLPDAMGRINLTLGSFPNDLDAIALRADAEARQDQLVPARNDALTVIQKMPHQARALAVLARFDLQNGNTQAALDRVAAGLKADPDNVQLLEVRAAALVMANRVDDALSTWQTIVRLAPRDVFARNALADLQNRAGHLDEAVSGFRAAATGSSDQDMQVAFVRFLVGHGKPEAAVAYLKELIRTFPDLSIYDLALAEYYRSGGQFGQATHILEAARDRLTDPSARGDILTSLAKVEAQVGRIDLAGDNIAAALKGDPTNKEALLFRAELEQDGGRGQDAVADLLAVLRVDPVNARAYDRLATIYTDQGQTKLAVDAVRRLAATNPGDEAIQIRLAALLQKSGNNAGAQDVLQQLTLNHSEDPLVWTAMIRLAIERKDWESANRALTRLRATPGMDASASQLNGEIQAAKGDDAAAMHSFANAIDSQVRPDADLVGRYARSAGQSGHSEEAAEFLNKRVATLEPQAQAALWPGIFTSWADAGKFDQALQAFHSAIAVTPANIDLYSQAAAILVAQGHVEEARRILHKGIASGAPRWALMMTLGDVDNGAGAFRLALADYKSASDDNPSNVFAANNYGSMIADLEPRDVNALTEARARLNGQETSNSTAMLDTIAWLDYRLGRMDEAKALLTKIDAKNSPSPQRRFHLAAVLLASGDKAGGEALLNSVKGMSFPGSGEMAALSPS